MAHSTAPTLDAQSTTLSASSLWSKLPVIGALIGLLGFGGMFATGSFHGEGLFAYLVAYLFFFSLAMVSGRSVANSRASSSLFKVPSPGRAGPAVRRG